MAEGAGTTVDVPYVGPVRRNVLYVVAAAVAGYVGYAWWKARGAVDEAAPVPPDDYGEDWASEAPGATTGSPTTGVGGGYQLVAPDGEIPPASNAEWTFRAISALGDIGYEPQLVAAALGKYLARKPLTAAEAELVNVARARLGPPPVGDFPVTMTESAPTSSVVPIPGVPAGVRVVGSTRTSVSLAWGRVPGAVGYQTHMDGRAGYVRRTTPYITITNLRPGKRYIFRVRAYNTRGVGREAPEVAGTTRA